MLFGSTLVSTILLATVVLASPWNQLLERSEPQYSENRAAALFQEKNEKPTFAAFSFTASPLTGSNKSAIAVTASLSFGCRVDAAFAIVDILHNNGTTVYHAGLIVPGLPAERPKLDIRHKDRIEVSVNATSGRVRVKNITTGKSHHKEFKPSKLCRKMPGIAVKPVGGWTFGHFGALTVHDIKVSGSSGSYKLSEATRFYMGKKGSTRVTTTFDGESFITFHQK